MARLLRQHRCASGWRALLLVVVAITGCSLAPKYEVPATPVTARYHTMGPWVVSEPGDQLDRAGWWKMYGDPQLDGLEQQLIDHNNELQAALAHYQQSQAYVSQLESQLYPKVGAVAQPLRERQSATRPLRAPGPDDYNSVTLGAGVDYDVDLWGRIRDSVAAGKDEAQASLADLASAQLSLEVQLADSYFKLRGLDQQSQLLRQTVVDYKKALDLTESLHGGGIASGLDVSRAQTQLSSAQSLLSQTLAARALLEHAIAVLVGADASEFALPEQTAEIALPAVPIGVPSTLLQRRPDIAAAERRVAAANAKIGVARAAYFPLVTLSAQGGLQSSYYANFFSAPNFFWSIGPTLAQYIFDGGLRRSQLEAAKAATNEASARYRGVVLAAFQQVEDNLSLLSELGTALDQQRDAASAAEHSVDLALVRYRRGAVGYLDVVQAQEASLDSQREAISIQTQLLSANVQLIHALGGGWSADALAGPVRPPQAEATAATAD
jgi:NodT family efflux transporter outer membrane factor (OMF) lipoprotein